MQGVDLMSEFEIEGMQELIETIQELEKLPQRVVTKAARQGANIDLRATKAGAPVYDGWLKAALKLVGERTSIQGKKVYEITFDRAYNSKLVKISKEGKRSYYPVSQEYGWITKGGKYVPGHRYMEKAAVENAQAIQQKMVDVLAAEIDKLE
jgi:hypothetical protein